MMKNRHGSATGAGLTGTASVAPVSGPRAHLMIYRTLRQTILGGTFGTGVLSGGGGGGVVVFDGSARYIEAQRFNAPPVTEWTRSTRSNWLTWMASCVGSPGKYGNWAVWA